MIVVDPATNCNVALLLEQEVAVDIPVQVIILGAVVSVQLASASPWTPRNEPNETTVVSNRLCLSCFATLLGQ